MSALTPSARKPGRRVPRHQVRERALDRSNQRGRAWSVTTDGARLSHPRWAQRAGDLFIIDPHFQTESTIFEMFTRARSHQTSLADDMVAMAEAAGRIDELAFIFEHNKALGKRLDRRSFSFAEMALLQMGYCILHPPALLVIDNMWLDLDHEHVNRMIQTLARELPNTTMVCCATGESSLLDYDQVHSL